MMTPCKARTICCLLLLLTLAGCASAGTAATPATPQPAPAPPINLFLWHAWSSEQSLVLGRLVEAYNSGQSQVRVLPQRVSIASMADDIRAASQAGGGPHIMLIPNRWLGLLAAEGILLPLDDYLPVAEQGRLLPTALAGARLRDAEGNARTYGVPLSVDTLALFYNRDNFPEPPPDTATMLAAARALSEPSATPPRWGLAYNLSLDATIGYLYAFEGRVFDEQGQVALDTSGRAGAEQWLAWTHELSKDPRVLAVPDGVRVSQEIAARQALMTVDWAHNIDTYRQLWGEQLGVATLPMLSPDAVPPAPYVVGEIAAVHGRASAGEHLAAIAFLRYLLGEQAQRLLWEAGRVPALAELGPEAENWPRAEELRALHTQAGRGTPALNSPSAAAVERSLRQMQRDVLRGLLGPADAVTVAAESLRALTPSPARLPGNND
jgi:maltose-binding protein MalE